MAKQIVKNVYIYRQYIIKMGLLDKFSMKWIWSIQLFSLTYQLYLFEL